MSDRKKTDGKTLFPVEILDNVGLVLWRAADNCEKRGWLQNSWGRPGGPQCLGGHIETAANELGLSVSELMGPEKTVISVVSQRNPIMGPTVEWNNAPGRTKEEVITALRNAARTAP